MTDLTSKIANSVFLQAVSRVSMAALLPGMMALTGLAVAYLNQRFEQQRQQTSDLSDRVRDLDGSAQAASNKAAQVAVDLAVAQSVLAHQQADMDRFRADTSTKLDQVTVSVSSLSTSVAGLAANIADWHRQSQP